MKTVIDGDRLMHYDGISWTYLRIATEEDKKFFSNISEFRFVKQVHVIAKKYSREYYLDHREAYRKACYKWRDANREEVREYCSEYNTRRSFRGLQAPEELMQTVMLKNRLRREIRRCYGTTKYK